MTRRAYSIVFPVVAVAAILLSCDDAVSPPPEAVLSLTLDTDSAAVEGRCMASFADSLPVSPQGEVLRLNPNTTEDDLSMLPRATDGSSGAKVSCSVVESAAGSYSVSASVSDDRGRVFQLSAAEVIAGIGTNAQISWISPQLDSFMSSSVCTLTVDEVLEGGGAIQLTYDCPQFMNKSRPSNVCKAVGTVVLEQCDR